MEEIKTKLLEWEQQYAPWVCCAEFIASRFYIKESIVNGKFEWIWVDFSERESFGGGLENSIEACQAECQRHVNLNIKRWIYSTEETGATV